MNEIKVYEYGQLRHLYMMFLRYEAELIEFNGRKAIYSTRNTRWPIEMLELSFDPEFMGKKKFLEKYGLFKRKMNI